MKVTEYKSFLSDQLYDECWKYSTDVLARRDASFFTNSTWAPDIVHDSGVVLVHPLQYQSTLYNAIKQTVSSKAGIDVGNNQILFYYWPAYSYIPWHNDDHVNAGITIYLNPMWNRNNGGLFLYESNQGIRGIVPEPNKCVTQQGGVPHATTPVMPRGGMRHTIQLWTS